MDSMKGKILIVEDDKVDRMAFERFAKAENLPYDYVFAGSVNEASEILENERFDAVLLDYTLGDGTAFDLFDKMKGYPFYINNRYEGLILNLIDVTELVVARKEAQAANRAKSEATVDI